LGFPSLSVITEALTKLGKLCPFPLSKVISKFLTGIPLRNFASIWYKARNSQRATKSLADIGLNKTLSSFSTPRIFSPSALMLKTLPLISVTIMASGEVNSIFLVCSSASLSLASVRMRSSISWISWSFWTKKFCINNAIAANSLLLSNRGLIYSGSLSLKELDINCKGELIHWWIRMKWTNKKIKINPKVPKRIKFPKERNCLR